MSQQEILTRKQAKEIIELLKLFNRKYMQTIIMITHDLEIAKQADRVLTIEDGKIVESDRRDNVRTATQRKIF